MTSAPRSASRPAPAPATGREPGPADLTLRQLRVLIAFIDTPTLARTAERLDTSTVSIHRALHALEHATQCVLFQQKGRLLVPTEAALILAAAAREAMDRLARGVADARTAGGQRSLKLGALYSLTLASLPRLIGQLRQADPGLQIELILGSNTELLAQLRQGRIDAALIADGGTAGGIASIRLFDDEIFFAAPASSRYPEHQPVDLKDCADEVFVTLANGFATYSGFVDAFRIAGYEPRIAMQVGDIFSLMNLVGGGVGCSLLPGRVREGAGQRLRFLPLAAPYRMRQTLMLCHLPERGHDPDLRRLAETCLEQYGLAGADDPA